MAGSFDVIIVGAGSVGLFLACELARAGVSVLVLEKETTPDTAWKDDSFGLRVINTPSIEHLYRRGFLSDLLGGDEAPRYFEPTPFVQFAGHFAGIELDSSDVDFSKWQYHLPRPLRPEPLTLLQLESAFSACAENLGVQIRRGVEVSQFEANADSVRVTAGSEHFVGKYLVGCDGGRSTIRREGGFEWIGTEAQFTGYSTDAVVEPALKASFHNTGNGMTVASQYGGSIYVLDFNDFDRGKEITQEHIENVLRRVTGVDTLRVLSMQNAQSFTDRAKQVTKYQKGRIILAGDSAHIHAPLGAQGLNLGLGDAMNLGWKLAATIKGYAATDLLSTYHQERHPAGAWVLDWARAQTAILRPDDHAKAMYERTRDFIQTQGGTYYFIDRMWGLSQRYELGDSHPLVGRSVPDFEFSDGQRLGPALRKAQFLVLDFEQQRRVADFVQPLSPIVEYCGKSVKENFGIKALLVRPDGIVAWLAEQEVSIQAFQATLSSWLNLDALEA